MRFVRYYSIFDGVYIYAALVINKTATERYRHEDYGLAPMGLVYGDVPLNRYNQPDFLCRFSHSGEVRTLSFFLLVFHTK